MKIKQRGFSLIELMVTIAIIGILATVAYPSYTEYTKKTYRVKGQEALDGLAMAMEKLRLERRDYRFAAGGTTPSDITTFTQPDTAVYPAQAPIDGSRKLYDLTFTATKFGYTLHATPISGELLEEDGYLELHHTGQKGWDQNNAGGITATEWCWKTSKGSC